MGETSSEWRGTRGRGGASTCGKQTASDVAHLRGDGIGLVHSRQQRHIVAPRLGLGVEGGGGWQL